MKIIIAGCRDITCSDKFDALTNRLLKMKDSITEIVSGGASGIDTMAIDWARRYQLPLKVFKADWGQYGKSAGPRRNREMAEYADILFAIWDGESHGTKNVIDTMKDMGKPCVVFVIDRVEDQPPF